MNDKVKEPVLPESHMTFLKEVAAAADRNGIQKFDITYQPHWDTEPVKNCFGEIKMIYSNTDGRGRPAHNMHIEFRANYAVPPCDS